MATPNEPMNPGAEQNGRQIAVAPRFKVLLWVLCLPVLFVLLVIVTGGGLVDIIGALAMGWWQFLSRTAPSITWNWDISGMAALCVCLILFGANWFLNWLSHNIARSRGLADNWRWPWKWTWCGVAALGVLFLTGMAVGGIAHQTGWIIGSPEPLFEAQTDWWQMNEMRQIQGAVQASLLERTNDIASVRGSLIQYLKTGADTRVQKFQILLILNPDGTPAGQMIFPRDPTLQAKIGGFYLHSEQTEHLDADGLREKIAAFHRRLRSL
jgi:hypothetical protein